MLRFAGASAIAMFAISAPAFAGEAVLYEPVPDWVEPVELDAATIADGPSEQLFDWQHRLEGGVVRTYNDRIVRIDNPEALTTEGTVKFDWSPDKGDLHIHRFEIIRDGAVIDLVKQGVKFDVIRREENLERRLLDGRLTATVAVPGLKEGDMLRVAHSTTLSDQALGEEMQVVQYLPPAPWRVGVGRAIVSWPVGETISWKAGPFVDMPQPQVRDGYQYLEIGVPIAKREDMPADAPTRFRAAPLLRVGSFESWQDLSAVMEPHFTSAANLTPGGEVEALANEIMAQSNDPRTRAALATQLVQDEVSYLLDGLDGGNYLPQAAEDTWAKRYGDCKAKSVLLLSLLQHMGIDANVVLVSTRGGDAMPELLPLPANFDHMIVRATIGGTAYWLDGTSTATRVGNMGEVPPFYYALPLLAGGSDLVPMTDRPLDHYDIAMTMTLDQTAGVDLPMLFEMRFDFGGPASAQFERIVDENDPETIKQIRSSFGQDQFTGGQVTDISITYDDEKALGTITLKGVADADFAFEDGKVTSDIGMATGDATFAPNRARPAWRDIPVATRGPGRNRYEVEIILPDGGEGYQLVGSPELDASYANTRITRSASVEGGRVKVVEEVTAGLGEVAVVDIPAARRNALQLSKAKLSVAAPGTVRWRWELDDTELRQRTAKARAAYSEVVEEAEPDDFVPLMSRAAFLYSIYDYAGAVEDYSRIIEKEPTADLHLIRADSLVSLGRLDQAVEDIQAAYDLDPANSTAYYQAQLLARLGRSGEAIELLDALPVGDDDLDDFADSRATVLGIAGQVESGLLLLEERLVEKDDSSTLLNADCWYRGLHKVALDSAVDQCTRAVERAQNPAGVLDSRALVHYRMGNKDAALADLDAALKLQPGLSNSLYLKGIILLEQGKREGRQALDAALRQTPELKDYYALFGISPAS
ncbi:DUF3857 domain-containing protein [Parerythrobacter lacustris]|uniref:Tetratricopeptide repeat protein n=1 Tax=Parerythrobacter lacustris TaxID=2969984 RepID=A0ABT1XSE0_9SPHN|nr:DUF3857 domain-containing protein [Parerythrobacter lacustris]MCR2834581.1 tetratricopeptide repeat protein [Parerythrobacter lacustris]